MGINMLRWPRPRRRGQVIALHCSGAGASQWVHLAQVLGDHHEVLAPEHYGGESARPWTGEHAFTLADEAARAIALVDESDARVHLVGHSYGGGVALHLALRRPDRIASMALYEPAAFHLLRQMGDRGAEALGEAVRLGQRTREGVTTGDYRGAAAYFADYWNGAGTWAAMRPSAQNALIRWAPKGALEFHALMDEPAPAESYRALRFPMLILRGEHGPLSTRLIAEDLSGLLPAARLVVMDGAGHMGPFTHASGVSALIARHMAGAEASPYASPGRGDGSWHLGPTAPPAPAAGQGA